MNWTKEKPTEPGYYIWKHRHKDEPSSKVCKVYKVNNRLMAWFDYDEQDEGEVPYVLPVKGLYDREWLKVM